MPKVQLGRGLNDEGFVEKKFENLGGTPEPWVVPRLMESTPLSTGLDSVCGVPRLTT